MKVRRRTSTPTRRPSAPTKPRRPRFQWFRPSRWLERLAHGHDRMLFAGAFAGSLIVGYLVAATILFPAPFITSNKTVPDVIGMDREAAEEAVRNAGLAHGDGDFENHPSAPVGAVVWQDPPAGVVLSEGATVELSLSQGPQLIPVPDVTEYDQGLARLLIESAGLAVQIIPIQTAAPRGVVVNTRPPPGSTRAPGTEISLLVSVGPPTITVPSLAGMTVEQAQDTLEVLGLSLGTVDRRISSAQLPETIFSQNPPANTLIASGRPVNVIVARQN